MLGALLTREEVVLREVPKLSDILVMAEMLEHFGARVRWLGNDLHICAADISNTTGPYHLVSKMRASFVAMGALVGRCGEARMAMPGGCTFGPRPVDRHIKAFKDLGAELTEEDGDFFVRRTEPFRGTVEFEAPTVGGTHNIILATALGEGTVTIENAALEPEIIDLANMLNKMGARISGAGSRTIVIRGVKALKGVSHRPIPDRIEAGTLMLAAAATRGHLIMRGVELAHMTSVVAKLTEMGVRFKQLDPSSLEVDARAELKTVDIVASEYPGIPTDVQAPFGACLTTVSGLSFVEERVYPGHRFTHVEELMRMGADLTLQDSLLTIQGSQLAGCNVHAADIRAGGALIVAALAAKGTTVITGLKFIKRGYENFAERLRKLGADIHEDEILQMSPQTGTYGD